MQASPNQFRPSSFAVCVAATLASAASLSVSPANAADFTLVTSSAPLWQNGYLTDQLYPQQVVSSPSGGFMVAWSDLTIPQGEQTFVRAFSSDGTPLGSATAIGDINVFSISLAASKNGDYVISWQSYVSNTPHAVFQRFDANGVPKGGMVDVAAQTSYNSTFLGSVYGATSTSPKVAMDDDGDVAVAWNTFKSSGFFCWGGSYGTYCLVSSASSKAYASIYGADNSRKKKQTVLQSMPTQYHPSQSDELANIGMSGTGNIVASFRLRSVGATATGIVRSNADLTSISTLQVLNGIADHQGLGVDSTGNFNVAWLGNNGMNVSGFDASGNAKFTTTDSVSSGNQLFTMSSSGTFAILQTTFDSIDFYGDGFIEENYHFAAQLFNADGSARGSLVTVDHDTGNLNNIAYGGSVYGSILTPAMDANGALVSVWQAILSDKATSALVGSKVIAP